MNAARENAETIGLHALTWLAGHEDLLPVFLGATGASEQDMRTGLNDPVFLGSVLDFILMDDAWVQQFCDAYTLPYEMVYKSRQMLPGGEQVNWT
ncbi:MAG: DUF3572 domain-containing protein [Roseovarius sp.]